MEEMPFLEVVILSLPWEGMIRGWDGGDCDIPSWVLWGEHGTRREALVDMERGELQE